MSDSTGNLGRLVAVYGIAPAYLQRAVFIVVLSFMFFLGMMFTYYIRQSAVYFLLATAFLVLYLITMISWFLQRRSVVQVFENGLKYKDRPILWAEISSIDDGGTITLANGKPVVIPRSISDLDALLELIRRHSQAVGGAKN